MKKTKINTDENVLYIVGWVLMGLLAVIVLIFKLRPELYRRLPPCIFQLLTGFYCPGCGGTRAVVSLLSGRFLASLVLHPFVPYTALVGGWFMISQTIHRISRGKLAIGMKYRDIYLWIALALVIVNFLVKNICLLFGVDLILMFA